MFSLKFQKVKSLASSPTATRTDKLSMSPTKIPHNSVSFTKHTKNKLSLGSLNRYYKNKNIADFITPEVSPKNSSLITSLRNISDSTKLKGSTSRKPKLDPQFVNSHYQLLRELSSKNPFNRVTSEERTIVLPEITSPTSLKITSRHMHIEDQGEDLVKEKVEKPVKIRIKRKEQPQQLQQDGFIPFAKIETPKQKPQLKVETSGENGNALYNEHKKDICFAQIQKIRGRSFFIEIARANEDTGLYIFGKDLKTSNFYVFRLTPEATEIILPSISYNYGELTKNLDLKDSKLTLVMNSILNRPTTRKQEDNEMDDFRPSKWERSEADEYDYDYDYDFDH